MENKQTFFDFAAEVGLTKHLGGINSTEDLVELCHIGKSRYILDVGCGVGVTACYLAKKYGCRVIGVDISEEMIEKSKKRVKKEGLENLVEFRVADAQDLPFENDLFDVVITESVTAFPEKKQKAVQEYARVTKSGGYVGLNESTWLKVPVPPEIIAWASQDLGASVKPLTSKEWKELLEKADLKIIETRIEAINPKDETRGILQRYGYGGMFGVFWRMIRLYIRNPEYRQFVKKVRGEGITHKHLDEYFGMGLYVGKK